MPVDTKHKSYKAMLPSWLRVDNAISGNVAEYLRNVGKLEKDAPKQEARQKEYTENAIYHNFSARTLNGMSGEVTGKVPVIDLPATLKYLIDNADGNGNTLEKVTECALKENIKKHRGGFFVDAPDIGRKPSRKEQIGGIASPRIKTYTAESIINWRTEVVGSEVRLTMVVLEESYDSVDPADIYSITSRKQWRTLMLDGDGLYKQILERETEEGEEDDISEFEPKMDGARMRHVPFHFFDGAEVSQPPLLTICDINIGHYKNVADHEDELHLCSKAMMVIAPSKAVEDTWEKSNPDGVQWGGTRGLNVGAGGNAFVLQASPNGKLPTEIKAKEEQAIALGAQIIAPNGGKTATEARMNKSADTSVLCALTDDISSATRKALADCAGFIGEKGDITFELDTNFYVSTLTPQERAQWVAEIMGGITPKEYYYDRLRSSGEFPQSATNEEIEAKIKPLDGLM